MPLEVLADSDVDVVRNQNWHMKYGDLTRLPFQSGLCICKIDGLQVLCLRRGRLDGAIFGDGVQLRVLVVEIDLVVGGISQILL